MNRILRWMILGFLVGTGCAEESPGPRENHEESTASKLPTPTNPNPTNPAPDTSPKKSSKSNPPTIQPLSLGALGGGDDSSDSESSGSTSKTAAGEKTMDSVLDAMQPLQVFLGRWNTTTRNKGAGSAKWVWDFQTDKSQPALVMTAKDHPYFESARLTFLTGLKKFQLTATDKNKEKRIYRGEFVVEPHFVTGDGGKPEPRFEIMLSEVGNETARKLVAVNLTQRNRDRMWMKVFQRSGKTPRLQDNVAGQRAGTSFAVSDTDYGEKECIVSQGLGTMPVTYMGRTYYVCCSGCQAAFDEDPSFWIDKAEERKESAAKPNRP